MSFNLRLIAVSELNKVLALFKAAAENIAQKNIDHWQHWHHPSTEDVNWVKEGIAGEEFFFIVNMEKQIMGMIRILDNDLLYWGVQTTKAKYIHSFVVNKAFQKTGLGTKVLQKIADDARVDNCEYLRLDCDAKNTKLCAYYQQQEFVKVGEKKLPTVTCNLYQKKL